MEDDKLKENLNNGNLNQIMMYNPYAKVSFDNAGPGQNYVQVVAPSGLIESVSRSIRSIDPNPPK